jgi:hypothetical protein
MMMMMTQVSAGCRCTLVIVKPSADRTALQPVNKVFQVGYGVQDPIRVRPHHHRHHHHHHHHLLSPPVTQKHILALMPRVGGLTLSGWKGLTHHPTSALKGH